MENLELKKLFGASYLGKKVLVTGHCGFKGSWLSLWLNELGANILGYSQINKYQDSMLDQMNLGIKQVDGDILDYKLLRDTVNDWSPDIIFHLAAQPLVGASYEDPLGTFRTNIMGSLNVYDIAKDCPNTKAIVSVTTDKVYDNKEHIWGYRESDPLGGKDPYSGSKAAMEVVTASYKYSFLNLEEYKKRHNILLATARAGNVIGGGDWSENRIIPDIMKSAKKGSKTHIRKPEAIRPWQHVLEPLSGYLTLGQHLLLGNKKASTPFNFGPRYHDQHSVKDILSIVKKNWREVEYTFDQTKSDFKESYNLKLDSLLSKELLDWEPVWDIEQTIFHTVEWYKQFIENNKSIEKQQLNEYVLDARKKNMKWAQ